jgi:segregation and condensation protein A
LAHKENLTELAGQLEQFFSANLSQLMSEGKDINLEQLLEWWSVKSQESSKDRVGVFWALLLLSAQSKVELSQEEFYGELKIKPFG